MKQAGVTADSSYLSLHPILIRCTSSHLFEQPAQVMRILEPHLVGNFADGLVRFQQTVFHPADNGEMDILDGRLEPKAMVEQDFDVGNNDAPAVLVDDVP